MSDVHPYLNPSRILADFYLRSILNLRAKEYNRTQSRDLKLISKVRELENGQDCVPTI